ncbi:hypothetical protein K438DRAFT_1952308 [Mycena galopus ATCC 62051]|nr:hypothetical protein K438DRAFT_1952308 [Mycena galopus ATCC 62051]
MYLLCRVGVSGLDKAHLIDHFINLPGPQHIQYNLPAEQQAVHAKLNAQKQDDNDSEVEIITGKGKQRVVYNNSDDEEVQIIAKGKGMQDDQEEEEVEVLERPALRILTGDAIANPICLDQDTTLSSSSSTSSLFSTRSIHHPTSFTVRVGVKWPIQVAFMANSFLTMESTKFQHLLMAACFACVFKTDSVFKPRTYTDARLQWARGAKSLQAGALVARHTEDGLWSCYAAQVPLRK